MNKDKDMHDIYRHVCRTYDRRPSLELEATRLRQATVKIIEDRQALQNELEHQLNERAKLTKQLEDQAVHIRHLEEQFLLTQRHAGLP